jgi:hypothetical protein
MEPFVKKQRWGVYLVFGLLCFFLLSANLLKGKKILSTCLNSDSLYLTTVYKDVFVDGFSFTSWILSPAPCFFPDMFFYFPLLAMSPDYGIGLIAYIVFYSLLLWGCFYLILRQCTESRLDAVLIGGITVLFLATCLHGSSRILLDEYVFVAGRHAGTLVSGLILLWLSIDIFLHGARGRTLFSFFILSYLAIFSDVLIVPQFLLPIACMMWIYGLFDLKHSRAFWGLVLAGGSAGGLAAVTKSLIRNKHPELIPGVMHSPRFSWSRITETASQCFHDFLYFFSLHPSFTVGMVFIFLVCFIRLFIFLSSKKKEDCLGPSLLPFVFGVFSASVVMTLLAPILKNMWFTLPEVRYVIPVFVYPFLVLAIMLVRFEGNSRRIMQGSTLVFVFVLAAIRLTPDIVKLRPGDLVLPYPPNVEFVDQVAEKYNVEYGLCDYWNANYLNLLSKKEYTVNQLHDVLWPYYWINNREWYWNTRSQKTPIFPRYTMLITDRLQKDRILKKFGEPAYIETYRSEIPHPDSDTYHDETEIYIYNRPSDVAFRNFLRAFFLVDEDPFLRFIPITPPALNGVKHDDDRWNAPGNSIIAWNQELEITYAAHTSGDVLEISVDSNDVYELTFWGWAENQRDIFPFEEKLTILPQPRDGLKVWYLRIPESIANKPIAKLFVKPIEGDGSYSVGHAWIYKDTVE